jgi:glycosyltransferase involved in cell wall biosynthesis
MVLGNLYGFGQSIVWPGQSFCLDSFESLRDLSANCFGCTAASLSLHQEVFSMASVPVMASGWSQVQPSQSPGQADGQTRPLISLVTPAYNEAAILEENLTLLCQHMAQLEDDYRWEIVVVNDGSRDDTARLADAFAHRVPQVRVVHHLHNSGLGQALRTGFEHCQGDYVVTLDLDLSYSPEHIEKLVRRMEQTGAQVVVASPYMEGGKISNVPTFRRLLSVWANRFLSLADKGEIATLTGMVRAYDRRFLQSLHPRSMGMDINPEILHKAKLLNERVDEIPAHLHWRQPPLPGSPPRAKPVRRKSSMKILRHSWSIFFYGFLFRPVMFFFIPSLICLSLGLYSGSWSLIHSWTAYQTLTAATPPPVDPTVAVAMAYQQAPHTFIIGGVLMMLGVQLLSLAVLSVQNKYYFEEIFYLATSIQRAHQHRPLSGE